MCSQLNAIMKKCNLDESYTMRDFRSRAILDMITASKANDADVSAVGDYVGIRENRLRAYVNSSHIIANIPSDLVNISVKPYSAEQDVKGENDGK